MDPFARRQMWDVIAAVSEQRSVVLTTHSMEVGDTGYQISIALHCHPPSLPSSPPPLFLYIHHYHYPLSMLQTQLICDACSV